MNYIMQADGGSRGNPGKGAGGAVIFEVNGEASGTEGRTLIAKIGAYLPHATNNVAEYTGIVIGLKKALELGIRTLTVKLDSELAVKQINGVYRVKNAGLKPYFAEVKRLSEQFEHITFEHVYREQNKEADAVVNECIDAERSL